MRKVESSRTRRTPGASGFFLVRLFRFQRDDAENVSHIFRVSSNSKCVFVPSGFSVSHVSLLIATPQKSRSSRLSDDPRGAQNSFGNESPAVHIPVSSDKFHLAH